MSMYTADPGTVCFFKAFRFGLRAFGPDVENNGVEPLTSCVQGRRSSQLS